MPLNQTKPNHLLSNFAKLFSMISSCAFVIAIGVGKNLHCFKGGLTLRCSVALKLFPVFFLGGGAEPLK